MQVISAHKRVLWLCHRLYYLFSYAVIFGMHRVSALHKHTFMVL